MTAPRQKFDRLLAPGATSAELKCDYAAAPFDRAARAMEVVWGIDRLPSLVSPQTAARFGAAIALMNEAINAGDTDRTAAAAENCIKGLTALDAEARRLGHQPAMPDVWQYTHEGKTYGIIRDAADWPPVAAAHPDLILVSLLEVANAVAAYRSSTVMAAVHQAFPGAVVAASRPRTELEESLNDEIPF